MCLLVTLRPTVCSFVVSVLVATYLRSFLLYVKSTPIILGSANTASFHSILMLRNALRGSVRLISTAATPYPFSSTVKVLPKPDIAPPKGLLEGKGLMPYLLKTLPSPQKQNLLSTLFSRRHPLRLLPGSVLTVTMTHAPTTFSGVLLSVRRRGPDTSFLLRNVIQRTGVEMQFFVNSPHLQDITVVQRAGGSGGKEGRRARRAKLFYLRDSPEKMSMISAGIKGR